MYNIRRSTQSLKIGAKKKRDILKLGMHTHTHQRTYRPRETRTAVKSGEISIFLFKCNCFA